MSFIIRVALVMVSLHNNGNPNLDAIAYYKVRLLF